MSAARSVERRPRTRGSTERVFRARELGIVLVLVLLIAVTGIVEPRFLNAAEPAQPPAQRLDRRAARGRPDARGRHPQHRPLGRLGARHHRVPRRRLLFADHGLPIPLVFVAGMALGAASSG